MIEVLNYSNGRAPQWRRSPYVVRDGFRFSDVYSDLNGAAERCSVLNHEASEEIEKEVSPTTRMSLRLRAEKALQAAKRLAEEEMLMLAQARLRKADVVFQETNLVLHKDSEKHRLAIVDQLKQFPYLDLVLIRDGGRPFIFFKLKSGAWSEPRWPNRQGVVAGYRSKIANGFELSGLDHWGKTKAKIREILLPRANELLQLAGVKRMLAEALANGRRVLVYGPYVFWYETGNKVGWVIKERAGAKDGEQAEALWKEGTIISKNHGRIVVLPYTKEDGTNVAGHTKNAPHDGPALPRHSDDVLEIPFHEVDGDLMIGLLGELPYE